MRELQEDEFTLQYAQFLLDCGLMNTGISCCFKPSVQAAAAIYVALKLRLRHCNISASNYVASIESIVCTLLGFPDKALRKCAEQMFEASNLMLNSTKLLALKGKYKDKISEFVFPQSGILVKY